jgi:hypothetical protein
MNFPEEIITVLKKAKTPLKASQILKLLKKTHPHITLDKKELNQIIWKDLRHKISYNNSNFTITLKVINNDIETFPGSIIGGDTTILPKTGIVDLHEDEIDSKKEININDILKIVAEEKIRLGTHEANLMAENITIRLKKKYAVN